MAATAGGVIGIILAGGQSQRMGGAEKSFLPLGGKPLIARVAECAAPQVDGLLISANGDPLRFAAFGYPVLADPLPEAVGPLGGILAGMSWIEANRTDADWLMSFACDTPFFPSDLVAVLKARAMEKNALVAVAASFGRNHPVFALWHRSILPEVRTAIGQGVHKMSALIERFANIQAEFADTAAIDPFFNINTPEDLKRAEAHAANSV